MLINAIPTRNNYTSSLLFFNTIILVAFFAPSLGVVGGISLVLIGAAAIGNFAISRVVRVQSVSPILYPVVTTGSGLSLIFGAGLALQPIFDIRWSAGTALFIGILMSVLKARHHIMNFQNYGRGKLSTESNREVVAIFVIALIYLGRDFRWANTAFVGGVLLLVSFLNSGLLPSQRLILRSSAVGLITLSLLTRTEFWWYVSNDHHWFEALGISIIHFGPWDLFGVNADVGVRYHFLTYLISGGISNLISAENFVILTRVLPVLIAVGISAVVWNFLLEFSKGRFFARFVSALSVPFLFQYSHASPSHTFGILLLLGLVSLVLNSEFTTKRFPQAVFGVATALALSLAKASVVPPVVLGLGSLLLLSMYKGRLNTLLWFKFAFVATSGAYILWQLFSARASSQLRTGDLFGYALERSGDLRQLGYTRLGILAMVLTTSVLLLPLVVAWIWVWIRSMEITNLKRFESLTWFVAPVLIYGLGLAVWRGNHSIGYFVTASLYVMGLPLLVSISDFIEDCLTKMGSIKTLVLIAFIPILVFLSQQVLLPKFNGGERYEVLVRVLLRTTWILPLLIVVVWRSSVLVGLKIGKISFLSVFIVWTVAAHLLPTITNLNNLEKGPEALPEESAWVVGSPDEQDVGSWLRNNLKNDVVVATNHFCGYECRGSGWFRRDLELPKKGFQFSQTPTQYGGANFFLPIYSERKFLAQGTYHLLAAGSDANLLLSRVESTLEFVELPSFSTYLSLRAAGATHVVVDRTVTTTINWEPWGERVYENETFVVLRLTT